MKKPSPAPTTSAAHEVRIIGGQWKRTRLPVADKPGLRPTPGRVRETLFNWLGQDLSGWRCLDAFAGSGALGLEAASRGALQVLLVEQDAQLVAGLRSLVLRLKAQAVTVERQDALAAMRARQGQGWDLVFLDPPFGGGAHEALFEVALQAARLCIHSGGSVYLESPRAWADDELAQLGWQAQRRGKAGSVFFQLLCPLLPQ